MMLEAARGDTAGMSIYAQQEGAFITVSLQDGDERSDGMLTPDQAERLAFELGRLAQEARKYGSEEGPDD